MNIYAILLAGLASTCTGFLWYAFLMKEKSIVKKEEVGIKGLKKKPLKIFLASFAVNVLMALVLAVLINNFKIKSFLAGLGIIIWIWFLLTVMSGIKKLAIEKKSFENFILGAGHDFVNIFVSVLILIFLA